MWAMNETTRKSERSPNASHEQRRQWVERFQQSGQTQEAFVRQHGIKLSTLQYWLYRKPKEPAINKAPAGWREVRLPSMVASGVWAAEMSLPNGVTVRLASQTAELLLAQILRNESCSR